MQAFALLSRRTIDLGSGPQHSGSDRLLAMRSTSDAAHEFALIDNGKQSCDLGTLATVPSALVQNGGHFRASFIFKLSEEIASLLLLAQGRIARYSFVCRLSRARFP